MDGDELNTQAQEKPEDVHLGRGAVAGILIALCLMAFILILTLRSCSVTKRIEATNQNPVQTPESDVQEVPSNYGESSENIEENSVVLEESASTGAEQTNPGNFDFADQQIEEVSEQSVVKQEESGNFDFANQQVEEVSEQSVVEQPNQSQVVVVEDSKFKEVAEPALGEEIETYGLIVSKSVYIVDSSYIYCLDVSMVTGDIATSVKYFCPKKTYNALQSGDTISITYQLDNSGNFSVLTISK